MKKTGFFVSAIFALVCVLAVFSCSNMLEDLRRARASANEEEGATPAGTPVVTTPPEQIPLTLEAVAANTTVTFTNKASGDVKYKVNDGDIQTIASNDSAAITLSAAGDKVSFFGDNAKYGALGDSNSSKIACDEECYVYGNIMSLIKSDGFENERTLTAEYAFACLFYDNANIKNKPGAELLLPAETLADFCYSSMFEGCTSLETVPEDMLPATNLADYCYYCMFYGCTGLTGAPELRATTLAVHCYDSMFEGCTSLETVPEDMLPATTLAECCYDCMFYGCASLTGAPELPATTLKDFCYSFMFKGCASLNNVTCLATDISAEECTSSWLYGVANSGEFYCNSLNDDWSSGANGIPAGWTTHTLPTTPLTLEAVNNNTTVTFTNKASGVVKYKVNDGEMQTIASNGSATITLSAHQKVSFFGDNARYGASNIPNSSNIACDEECYVYGNIMSLIKSEGFENERTLTEQYAFANLFRNNANIKNKPGAELLLPAETLAEDCYSNMFYGCTSLTSAPELPATTLAEYCYLFMFEGCTSLETVPEDMLPATTLKEYCYNSMFDGCTSLTSAPELPATTLAVGCYNGMFDGCTSLSSAPELPATTLKEYCYSSMFFGCTSLNTVTCLATDISASYCVTDWLAGTAGGTFYRNPSVSDSFWAGKVPVGWTVHPYQQP